jgi:hypothetical protein
MSTSAFAAVVAGGLGVSLVVTLFRRARKKPSGTLWACPPTTCSRRAIMALVEAGVDFEFVPIDLAKGEHKQPTYLLLQPYGKVPAWVDNDGFQLFESRAIMRYVAEGSHLIPTDPATRAVMDQWISVEYSYFYPAFIIIYAMRVLKKIPLDEAAITAKRAEYVAEGLQHLSLLPPLKRTEFASRSPQARADARRDERAAADERLPGGRGRLYPRRPQLPFLL